MDRYAMINLKQGANVVAVTLGERGGEGPDFILRLRGKASQGTHNFPASDDSPHPARYNRLSVDIGSIAPGQYDYEVLGAGSPEITLETGIAVVEGESAQTVSFVSAPSVTAWRG